MRFRKTENASIDSRPHYRFRSVFADPIVVSRKAAIYTCSAFVLATRPAFCHFPIVVLLELDPGTAQIKRVILEQLFVFRMKSSVCCLKQNLTANKQLRLPEA